MVAKTLKLVACRLVMVVVAIVVVPRVVMPDTLRVEPRYAAPVI